ncbi:large neutral amino acids transporter small subunit 2-like [Eudromia elegans]
MGDEDARRRRGVPRDGDTEGGDTNGDTEGGGVALKKELGLLSACGVIVGNIVGSGIFVAPGGVLAQAGSVGLALAVWALAGAVTAAGALCYAELGLAVPRAGGDYAYVKEAFGGLLGFLRLWVAVLVVFPSNQGVTMGSMVTPWFLRLWVAVLVVFPSNQAVMALTFAQYALQPLLLLTWVNGASARWATRVQDVFTAGKLLALGLVIAVGLVHLCRGEVRHLIGPMGGGA